MKASLRMTGSHSQALTTTTDRAIVMANTDRAIVMANQAYHKRDPGPQRQGSIIHTNMTRGRSSQQRRRLKLRPIIFASSRWLSRRRQHELGLSRHGDVDGALPRSQGGE